MSATRLQVVLWRTHVWVPVALLLLAALVSYAPRQFGDTSYWVGTVLTTAGLCAISIAGFVRKGLLGSMPAAALLFLVFALWPVYSVLANLAIDPGQPSRGYALVFTVALLAGFLAVVLAWKAQVEPRHAQLIACVLLGSVLGCLVLSWVLYFAGVNLVGALGVFLTYAQTLLYGTTVVGLSVLVVWHELAHVDEGGVL